MWTDKFVFAKAVSETKLMSELEYEVYSAWYEPVVHVLPALVPDAFIYLQADPEVCYERLKTRNRSEESSVAASVARKRGDGEASCALIPSHDLATWSQCSQGVNWRLLTADRTIN